MIVFLVVCVMMTSAQTAKQYKNVNNDGKGRNPDAIRHGRQNKVMESTKAKLEEQRSELTIAGMSFSREELFDRGANEVTNAYIRIYQAIGEVIRMSHQYNIVDLDNQRGISYVSHMLTHISEQSNKDLDNQIAGSINSKIQAQSRQTETIQNLAKEVSEYAEIAAKKIAEFELKMKEISEIKSTPTIIYIIALTLQALTAYFIYVIYKRNIQL